jgi:hypothetical protein
MTKTRIQITRQAPVRRDPELDLRTRPGGRFPSDPSNEAPLYGVPQYLEHR